MKLRFNQIFCISLLSVCLLCQSCNKSTKQESAGSEGNKALKQNSPLDEQKIKKSNAIMMDIYNQMNFIPNMDHFLNIVNHFRSNHLFVNADTETYVLIGVTNKGFMQIPEGERNKLLDTSTANNGYQLNFLIHHIIGGPKTKYKGMIYRSLAGDDVDISEDRSDLHFKEKRYPIISSLKYSDELEIIAIDSPLFQ